MTISGYSNNTGNANKVKIGTKDTKVYINDILVDMEDLSKVNSYIKNLQNQIMILSDFIKMMMISNNNLSPDHEDDLITPIDFESNTNNCD